METLSNFKTKEQFNLLNLMYCKEQNTHSQIPSQETENPTPQISNRSVNPEGVLDFSRKSIKTIKSVLSLNSSINTNTNRNQFIRSIKQTKTPSLDKNYFEEAAKLKANDKKTINYSKRMKKALNNIIPSKIVETYQKEMILAEQNKILQQKNSRNVKNKAILKPDFLSFFKLHKSKITGGNDDFSLDFFNNFLNDKKYIKHIKRYMDISRDEKMINNMTKYLKEVYNIKSPSSNELQLVEAALNQLESSKKIRSLKGLDKKELFADSHSFRKMFGTNNSNFNASTTADLNNPNANMNSYSNSIKADINKVACKPICFTFSKEKSKENFKDLCGSLPCITNKKDLLIRKCDSQIKINKNLINVNTKKNNLTDIVIKETFNKVFSIKDIKLEKELAKDHMMTLKKSGKFIYGESQGYYTNNRLLLFSKIY
jgi:hypothetical protein